MGELVGNRSRIGECVALEGKIGRKKLQYGTFLDLKYLFAVLESALPAEETSCNVFIHITLKEKNGCLAAGLQMAPEKQK